jgi:hypothetical protein
MNHERFRTTFLNLSHRQTSQQHRNTFQRAESSKEYLNDSLTHGLIRSLNEYFQTKVEIPRTRMGKEQEIETSINEEALLFASYLRNEKRTWIPRIMKLD